MLATVGCEIADDECDRAASSRHGRIRDHSRGLSRMVQGPLCGERQIERMDRANEDRIDRTTALQWMFFEQNSLEPYLGAAFFWLTLVKGGRELQVHALEDWMEKGYQAFGVMEKHLATHDFVAAGHYTIADIALYGYTHLAHECDFDLQTFPAIRAWLNRIVDQPGHVAMDWHPAAEAVG